MCMSAPQERLLREQLIPNLRKDLDAINSGGVEPSLVAEESRYAVPFYSVLKGRRVTARIKQEDLAQHLGITQMSLSKFENGWREPHKNFVAKWEAALAALS